MATEWCAVADCTHGSEHRHCGACGLVISGTVALCPHHTCGYDDEWAAVNRIMCDFLHRRIAPPRAPMDARWEDASIAERAEAAGAAWA